MAEATRILSSRATIVICSAGKLPYSSTWRLQDTNNGYNIMAPVVHSYTIILFYMTPTPDVVYRRLPARSMDSHPNGNYYKSGPPTMGSRPVLLALECHFNLFFSPHNFSSPRFF